jgi:signal transduction histidine kinase/DNA-binding NarL/FixJ family response regulator
MIERIPRNFEKIPLQLFLIVPFVLQIFAAVGITGWLSLSNGQKGVNNVARQLRSEVTNRIQDRLQLYLAKPQEVNQINASLMASKQIDPQNMIATRRLLWETIRKLPDISYYGFGYAQGQYVGAEQVSGKLPNLAIVQPGTTNFLTYEANEQGQEIRLISDGIKFLTTERPWYKKAVKVGKATWSPIYLWAAPRPDIAIAAVQPVYNPQGSLVGVLTIDLSLLDISKFLKTLKIGKNGKTFIIERSGNIVASSTDELPIKLVSKSSERRNTKESQVPQIKETTDYIQQEFGNLTAIQETKQLEFFLGQRKQFIQVTPFRDKYNLDWLIVVIVPEADFMEEINANTYTTILLCLSALVLAIALGIFTSRWISQPILCLSQASKEIAKGNLEQKVEIKRIKELDVLAQSFNYMAVQLNLLFNTLEETNAELEARVEIRTSALKESETKLREQAELLEIKVEERTTALNQAKIAAEVANDAKSKFIGKMSHELRTPLNIILGFTQIMKHEHSLKPAQQENIEIIYRSASHLLELINDILAMSKLESNQLKLEEDNFDLSYLLDELAEKLQPRASLKQLELIFQNGNDLPQYVIADREKLSQVLLNILDNAIKFTETGRVILRVVNNAVVDSSHQEVNGHLLFEIADTGPGIAPNEINTLFTPFVQMDTNINFQKGAGIGLAISQKFVQLMGGNITVSSEIGVGTVFKFAVNFQPGYASILPAKKTRKQVIGLEPGQPLSRILVVDNQWENRQLLVKLLSPLGFEVQEAINGQEAVDIWQNWQPHLVLMDLEMPVMGGDEATKQIRGQFQGEETIIIALTTNAFDEDRTAILSGGYNDFINQPFEDTVLFEQIGQYLGVGYIYAAETSVSLPQESSLKVVLNPDALREMPADWVVELGQAAIQLDTDWVLKLIEQIPDSNHHLATVLTAWVNSFQFDKIIDLI